VNRFRSASTAGPIFFWSRPRDRPYQAGRSKHWIKVKNREHQAFNRVMERFREFSRRVPFGSCRWLREPLLNDPSQLRSHAGA
jgi:hypothetical protein